MNNKDIIGFRLLIEYPGCSKRVGHFERCTTGEFLRYPEIWKPVFTKEYLRDKKIDILLG